MINALIGKENISHVTMYGLGQRFGSAPITDKLLNTETEVEKDIIKNIEVFKKIVTGDELSVEEKFKNTRIIKPYCKFIWGTNNLPQLNVDDNGYYRRINILPFNMKITHEQDMSFDKKNILTQEALDYLANISLREYLKIKDTGILANEAESNKIINKYRESNNSVETFLNEEFTINEIFANSTKIPNTVFYGKYINWCKENNYFIKKKNDFYDEVLSRDEYRECILDGRNCFEKTNITPKSKSDKFIKF